MDDRGDWNMDTLKEHILTVIRNNDCRYQQRFEAMENAVTKAETASEKRFDGVNEFRATLADQQRTLMPRIETEVKFNALHEKINRLEDTMNKQQAEKAGLKSGWGWAVAVVALVGAALAIAFAFRAGP